MRLDMLFSFQSMQICLCGKAKCKMTNAVNSNYSLHPKGRPKCYYSQTCSPNLQISSQPQNLICQTVSIPALLRLASSQLLCLKRSVFQAFWSRDHLECTSFLFKPREKLKNSAWNVGFSMVSILYGWLSIDSRCWSHQGWAQGTCLSGLGRNLTWTPNFRIWSMTLWYVLQATHYVRVYIKVHHWWFINEPEYRVTGQKDGLH